MRKTTGGSTGRLIAPWALILLSFIADVASSSAKPIPVDLGREFRLKRGESAAVIGGRAFLRIAKFINSPCPKGAYCIWSGQAVITELTVDGKVVPPNAKDSPYAVTVKDSDYRTFAVLVVDEPELALCRKISDAPARDLCLEDLAQERNRDELCREVVSATRHCLYLKSKASGDLAACAGIATRRARALLQGALHRRRGRPSLLLRARARAGRGLP